MARASFVFLISVTIVLLLVCFSLFRQEKEEGFANPVYTVKNLEINACPTFAPEVQTAKGKTDCCQGELIDGKCNASTFCTKSPAYDSVKGCVDTWRTYFQKKSTDLCPATMQNYYEDITKPNSLKGCSAGPILKDGKAPQSGTAKQCKIYPTEVENLTKTDSCYLEKERIRIQCPVVNRSSPTASMQVDPVSKKFQYFFCQYPLELGLPDKCFDKKTFYLHYDATRRNWRTEKGTFELAQKNICDNYIVERNKAKELNDRLERERREREAAQARLRALQSRFNSFMNLFKRNQQNSSRLQQQLDEANRKAQQCKK